MKDHIESCKRKAHQIKSDYPELSYVKRLDVAAKAQGFKHYTALKKLYDLLGPDKSPSHLAIVEAGGDPALSPYQMVSKRYVDGWSQAKPV
ncbi:hypothetical protein [Pseudaeromonas paramecii]